MLKLIEYPCIKTVAFRRGAVINHDPFKIAVQARDGTSTLQKKCTPLSFERM